MEIDLAHQSFEMRFERIYFYVSIDIQSSEKI